MKTILITNRIHNEKNKKIFRSRSFKLLIESQLLKSNVVNENQLFLNTSNRKLYFYSNRTKY